MTSDKKIKIALIGAGQIGATLALLLETHNLCNEIVLLDVVPGMAEGKALDLCHASSLMGYDGKVCGSNDMSSPSLNNADVVVITAGLPRKEGMTREDLLHKNAQIIESVAEQVKAHCPHAFVILTTNPLDMMVCHFIKVSRLPKNKVVGMAGVLDAARFKFHLAEAMKVSVKDIQATVIGCHGDEMVPVKSACSVSGIPIEQCIERHNLLTEEQFQSIVERTQKAGGEVVSHLKMGSAFYAPACAVLEMVKSYLHDEGRILPCSTRLQGEYGYSDVFCGVPVVINKNGIDKIIELKLTLPEKVAFEKSVESVKEMCHCLHRE